ncbi:gonadal somatic cell derived factor [Brachyhypopomus gauderio]|uniref:gonadal somatic cell derived factor n=1 Tax=Brachyhypopomus gauderio TaxID=698409 RepID=UPI004042F76C
MALLLLLTIMLVVCQHGTPVVLRRSPGDPGHDQTSPDVVSRCTGEGLRTVRKVILDSLSLQAAPHVSVPGMTRLRDQWKTAFEGTGQATAQRLNNLNVPESRCSAGDSSSPMCCTLTSQVFIKDLGWDHWIIYPESFSYTQCSAYDPRVDPTISHCAEDSPKRQVSSSQKLCCEPTSYDVLPFLYVDAMSTLVITSVPMIRECGCRPVDDPEAVNP